MILRKALVRGLAISAMIVLAGCSKNGGTGDFGDNPLAQGLGRFAHFAGQMAGESYTTQAPHDQLYLFSYDDSALNPKYLPSLEAQAAYLRDHPSARVLVAGHTDENGSREYNVALGERRAHTVAHVLRNGGVSRNQVRIVSYGKERPINMGHSDEAHAQNRRVEFTYEATR